MQPSIQAASKTKLTILLVDDDEIDTELVKRAFRLQNANPVVHAVDGFDALALLRGQSGGEPLPKPYIILLDINMPRMNGLEFLRELRLDAQLKGSVVFVLTTSSNPGDKLAAYDAHVAGYILKQNVGRDFGNALRLLNDYQSIVLLSN